MGKSQVHKIFEANDGRVVSSDLLIVGHGHDIELYSTGWDCDLNEKITPYVIFNFPAHPECDEALAAPFVEDCKDGCETIQQPSFELTKRRSYARITKPGAYFLHRTCGAETVTVWYKRIQSSQ